MDNKTNTPDEPQDDSASLEGGNATIESTQGTSLEDSEALESTTPDSGDVHPAPSENDPKAQTEKQPSAIKNLFTKLRRRFNIYLLLFILLLIIAGAISIITAISSNEHKEAAVSNQTLSEEALKQLANSDTTVGDPKQILNAQSNAVFAGKVLIRDNLDVAGQINVGGALSLPGITVSGASTFDEVQVSKTLTVSNDTSIQGRLTVRRGVSVTGNGTFGGAVSAPQISTSALLLSGDLNLTRHVIIGGVAPGRTILGPLGGGGTGSVSGSDSGGTVNLNTGNSPAAGCLVTVTFAARYNNTPHVVITPVGSAAAGLDYYVTRTTSSFNICTLTPPPASASFAFDYFVTG